MTKELVKLNKDNFCLRTDSDILKELKKFEICWAMLRLNKKFTTDIGYNNYTIDVLDISSATAYFIVQNPTIFPERICGFAVQVVNYTHNGSFKTSISRSRIEREKKKKNYWKGSYD